jgi:hypothetical protein
VRDAELAPEDVRDARGLAAVARGGGLGGGLARVAKRARAARAAVRLSGSGAISVYLRYTRFAERQI